MRRCWFVVSWLSSLAFVAGCGGDNALRLIDGGGDAAVDVATDAASDLAGDGGASGASGAGGTAAAGAGGTAAAGGAGGMAAAAGAGGTVGVGGAAAAAAATDAATDAPADSGGAGGASGGRGGGAGGGAPDGGGDASAAGSGGRGGAGGVAGSSQSGGGGGGGSGGGAGGGSGAPSIGRDVGCVASRTIWSGTETLLEAFPVADGIIVVTEGNVRLVSRAGAVLKTYTPPRPLTAAAFDGTLLGLADAAFLTALTPSLEPRGMVLLTEPCASAVMVSGQRFICGPENDWDRVFYNYDLVQLAELGRSPKYTYKGIPMRRIVGRDHFVTVSTGSFPADFFLHRVDSLGPVYFMGESPYHGDFTVNQVYAFAGRPASHLITSDGLMLRIFSTECDPSATQGLASSCFTKDGNVGTLWANERFFAMANDEERDLLYGVAGTTSPNVFPMPPACAGGCKVQRIDPVRRLVVGQRSHTLPVAATVIAHHDRHCQMLLFGYRTGDAPAPTRLDLLEHGGE